jgi:uncharacterized phage protein (TIGR02220 family)
MKDPAFLFYSNDFLTGTLIMPFDERGKYITLLCYQHQNGRMNEETIRLLVGSISDNLKSKFKQDSNGLFYNERLESEIEKRTKFIESRTNNGKLGGRPKETKKPLGLASANLIENENIIENIIEYLNNKTGKNFKTNSKTTLKHINARLSEKYTFEDFKKVIENKTAKWINDPKMVDYLRPETLFGTKFESYLNECIEVKIPSTKQLTIQEAYN